MCWEGRGVIVRAWSFPNIAACRAVSYPAWCRIFREISCLPPLKIGTLFLCCVLGQGTLPSHASLVIVYLVGQKSLFAEIAAWLHVCSPWSWNGTQTNRSSDQGVRCRLPPLPLCSLLWRLFVSGLKLSTCIRIHLKYTTLKILRFYNVTLHEQNLFSNVQHWTIIFLYSWTNASLEI